MMVFSKSIFICAYKILNIISFGKIINNAGYFKIMPPCVTKKLKSDKEYLPYWNYLITKYSQKNKKKFYTRGKKILSDSKFGILTLNPWMTYFGGFAILNIILLYLVQSY